MTISEKHTHYVMPTYGRFPIVPVKAEGNYLWDDTGKKYLDFCTGIAVCSLGHCHPTLVETITQQAKTLTHCSNLYQIPAQAELAEYITKTVVQRPGKTFFSNSGAEANDGLIKLARKYGQITAAPNEQARYEVITFNQSFHGRTLGGIAATGQEKVKLGFAPTLPGFVHLDLNDLESVKKAISDKTVAILVEPIQGEGGINVCSPEFLKGLQALCKEHDLLFMLDEIQCGLGRTGSMMSTDAWVEGIKPDAVSWAKGMGGGIPIGAFWASDKETPQGPLCDILSAGTHGSTYGGNPLSTSVSLAVLKEIVDGTWCGNVTKKSRFIQEQVAQWNHPAIKEIKGVGFLLGFELNAQALNLKENQTSSGVTVNALMEAGMLTVMAGPNVVRWLPALNANKETIREGLKIMKSVLDKLVNN